MFNLICIQGIVKDITEKVYNDQPYWVGRLEHTTDKAKTLWINFTIWNKWADNKQHPLSLKEWEVLLQGQLTTFKKKDGTYDKGLLVKQVTRLQGVVNNISNQSQQTGDIIWE